MSGHTVVDEAYDTLDNNLFPFIWIQSYKKKKKCVILKFYDNELFCLFFDNMRLLRYI